MDSLVRLRVGGRVSRLEGELWRGEQCIARLELVARCYA